MTLGSSGDRMSLTVSVGEGEGLYLRGAMDGQAILTIGDGIEIVLGRSHVAALRDQAGATLRDVRLVLAAEERLDDVHDAAAQARTAASHALAQAEAAARVGADEAAERARAAARAAIEVADIADAAVLAAVEAMVTVEDATDKVTAAAVVAAQVGSVSEPV
ncbi:hypothetical protein B0I31_110246 [Saccharothrix carnea]|uniref:Uncharacterized protein n=1 Tax=Saccharothrix carnea TaxID=1280637 RepID=A0A2P8I3W9_SACCR|nr:hypothetical protein [Saccharothrix carnea]PSL53153.1 hypothetical protein B0I31_110246 [Saccharothrix carnea]